METVSYNGNSLVRKIAVPKFSKHKERLLIILAKSLLVHCTLLVSNKNIFTYLVTLVCIPSYNCVTILTS